MNIEQQEAWALLTEEEKMALTLSLSHSKSTWEAGEIMGKTHYKYLETLDRAKRFFKMFAEYLTLYGELIPEDIVISVSFREYIINLIQNRYSLKTTLELLPDKNYETVKYRNNEIIGWMSYLRKLRHGKDLFNLIHEFDRWNNFRILPLSIQEPSAYKRRNHSREKRRLNIVSRLPEITINVLIDKFQYRIKSNLKKGYIPIVTDFYSNGYIILTIKITDNNLETLSKIGLPIFLNKDLCISYINLVKEFLFGSNQIKLRQTFWVKFRNLNEKAINYYKLEKISDIRENLEFFVSEHDIKTKMKQNMGIKPITNLKIERIAKKALWVK